MPTASPAPPPPTPLTPAVLQILLALAGRDLHGYAIMKEAESRSGGAVRLGPGTLYGAIKRLLADGWIAEAGERPDEENGDERRRHYRLTDLGRTAATAEAQRLAALVELARERDLLGAARAERPT